MISQAFILAAGLGTRLRPLTDHTPKPLLPIEGTCCLDFSIRILRAYGAQKIVVNTHHLAPLIWKHLEGQRDIIISHEEEILESGGGILNALHHFKDAPFFVMNADVLWQGGVQILKILETHHQNDGITLALIPQEKSCGQPRNGDYAPNSDGTLIHRDQLPAKTAASYLASGVHLTHPKFYQEEDLGRFFSNRLLWDKFEQKKRLYGAIYDYPWIDIGTQEDIKRAESMKIL